MIEGRSRIFFARNISELLYHIKAVAGIKVVGGCTLIKNLPEKFISSIYIPELKEITKHERYIKAGPGATLSSVQALGERHLPKILNDALAGISNIMVKNIATLGGNILNPDQKLTLYAPLLALDTVLELQSFSDTKIVSLQNFTGIPQGYIVSNIKIPLNDWDISIFCRLGAKHKITRNSASFAFLAHTGKGVITNLKIALGGAVTFRCLDLENKMIGMKLPLSAKNISAYTEEAAISFYKYADKIPYHPMLAQQFINLVYNSLEQLT